MAGLPQLVKWAHICRGLCLDAEGPGFKSDQWRFPACVPSFSPLPYLAVLSIKGGNAQKSILKKISTEKWHKNVRVRVLNSFGLVCLHLFVNLHVWQHKMRIGESYTIPYGECQRCYGGRVERLQNAGPSSQGLRDRFLWLSRHSVYAVACW